MVKQLLQEIAAGKQPSENEIVALLSERDPVVMQQIFAQAREARDRVFGGKVFVYGFVYFSTYCRNECAFCLYRCSNQDLPRYRKSEREILAAASLLADSGVHLIDLTMGEDPEFYAQPQRLINLVRGVKEATGLPVMISAGILSTSLIRRLQDAGGDWLAVYQETHNRSLFAKRRLGQSFNLRMKVKRSAAAAGMLIEEGILAGFGESLRDHARSFAQMGALGAHQVRSMTFVAQKGTPLQDRAHTDRDLELLDIALMRLLFPDGLIPASLDVEGLAGLERRLLAGANVVTSLIPPHEGLAGVSQQEKDILAGGRTVSAIAPIIEKCGLHMAAAHEYKTWVEQAKEKQRQSWSDVV
ncbi:MAG: methylornithine synthase PylB [Peptococcaceae bacterium]|jgi:methylornithine synthase|nr:methylornithine synthase PylB [Peptococcaceae bacterium]